MRSYIIRWQPSAAVCRFPFAVPDIFLADAAAASAIDRGHSLGSLAPATGGRLVPLLRCPVCALARTPALHTDRCHSLRSLYLPPAALPSLPKFSLATSSLPRVEGLRPSVVALPTEPKPCYINGFSFLYVDKASPFYVGMSLSLTLIIL